MHRLKYIQAAISKNGELIRQTEKRRRNGFKRSGFPGLFFVEKWKMEVYFSKIGRKTKKEPVESWMNEKFRC
ncbi:hypothetical protein BSM4216_2099 [Bacillus smithii]|jgi:hypothetical protein|nr:hypothetical protein BSM4216_2099 [Bacillus smithii]